MPHYCVTMIGFKPEARGTLTYAEPEMDYPDDRSVQLDINGIASREGFEFVRDYKISKVVRYPKPRVLHIGEGQVIQQVGEWQLVSDWLNTSSQHEFLEVVHATA